MSWRPNSDVSETTEKDTLKAGAELAALNNLEQLPEADQPSEWVDQGVRDVPVADLPNPEGIHNAGDFVKVSEDDMRAGLQRLQEMRPTIESGVGASSDYWADVDKQQGMDYAHGYRRIYDAFYGQDAIRLCKDGDRYSIDNGRHRIWLAKQMGIASLPARVIERTRR